MRRQVGGFFEKGEVTDENSDLVLMSGLIPRQDLFRSTCNRDGYAAFVGTLEYVLDKAQLPSPEDFVPLPDGADEEFARELEEEYRNTEYNITVQPDFSPVARDKSGRASGGEGGGEELARSGAPQAPLQTLGGVGGGGGAVAGREDQGEEDVADMDELLTGPAENFFGAGGEAQEESEGAEGLTLAVFCGDTDQGELVCDDQTSWAEVLSGVEQLTGKAGQGVVLQYPHPDGTRMVKLTDADAWQSLLALAADPDWDLDGFMEVEVVAE